MDATTAQVTQARAPVVNDDFWIRLAAVWHIVLALAALGSLVVLWSDAGPVAATWLRIVLTVVALSLAAGSGLAAVWIIQRDHRGRVLSLGVNYLSFIITLALLLTAWNAFIGLDGLANTFGRGLPFLAFVLVGYLVSSLAGRSGTRPETQNMLRLVGRVLIIVGGVAFLVAIGLFSSLLSLAGKYTNPSTIALTMLLAILSLMLWAMWRQSTADAFQATNADAEMLNGYLFLSPNLLGFLLFFAGPLLFSLYVSFTNSDAFGTRDWIGLSNYANILNLTVAPLDSADQVAREVIDVQAYSELSRFTLFGRSYIVGAADRLFWVALGNTLRYVLLVVPLCVIPALLLSNLLNSKIRGMTFFRAAYFIPSVAAVVGIALVWQWLYSSSVGYINYFITLAVTFLNSSGLFDLVDPQIRWLSDSRTALLSVIIMAAWQLIGFNTVLFLAGLQSIPGELYEAATVDGAGPWTKFWRLTLPLLAPTTFFVLTTTVIRAMQVFEEIFILIPANPAGPNNSTLSIVLYLYQRGFQRFEQGYASAIAWVLFLLIFGATLFQFQRQRANYEG